ncbi:thioredoxin family protein [Psychromonas antarctica]|jgi:putative thioredoxin|uniref:thioredoxin family protein n=1 Tax=Psychromonas antarctica TaxID=67573 RepID=UPI001EE8CF8A|nr:co-chaperone YbbN [Psychromonas antarctica]MCG6201207.1 co-chaperone YbbN [Psychromonas antarctica]
MQANSYDVSVSTFPQIIIEGSKEKPVLVFFWSPRCPICTALLPLLDKLHGENNYAFTLARINCDTEPQIVSHFGVQSVPSAFMFKDGQGVDGFAGEQNEEFIRQFINKHTPNLTLELLQQGQTLFAQGKLVEAKTTLLEANKLEPENNEINLALAQIYLALGDHEIASPILELIPLADQNMIYHSLIAQLQIALESAQTPEIDALEAQLQTAQDKQAIEYQLAIQYQRAKRNSEALALLYKILVSDLGYENGDAKKMMLDLLATIDDAVLVSQYRRKLYSLLY